MTRALEKLRAALGLGSAADLPHHPGPWPEPGTRGKRLAYGGMLAGGYHHDGPYAILRMESSTPSLTHARVVELALMRIDPQGTLLDSLYTLLDPGPTLLPEPSRHGITRQLVQGAPTFAEVGGELLRRLSGSVLVTHRAFEEDAWLHRELDLLGVRLPLLPALDVRWLAGHVLNLQGNDLTTLARAAHIRPLLGGIGEEVRTLAALLPVLLHRAAPVSYPVPTVRLASTDPAPHLHPRPKSPPRHHLAQPGDRGPLLSYGGPGVTGETLRSPLAFVDLKRIEWGPGWGQIVEIAVVRTDASGLVTDELATLVRPRAPDARIDPWQLGLTSDMLATAPSFAELAPRLLDLLQLAVVVCHDAGPVEHSLHLELESCGIHLPHLPAVDTLWHARLRVEAPSYALSELLAHLTPVQDEQVSSLERAHGVRTLLGILRRLGLEVHHVASPRALPVHLRPPTRFDQPTSPCDSSTQDMERLAGTQHPVALLRRDSFLCHDPNPWKRCLLAGLPLKGRRPTPAHKETYLRLLSGIVERGRLLRTDARALAELAERARIGRQSVLDLHSTFLDALQGNPAHLAHRSAPPDPERLEHARRLLDLQGALRDLLATQPPPSPRNPSTPPPAT